MIILVIIIKLTIIIIIIIIIIMWHTIPSLEGEDANCQYKPKIYSEKSRKSKNCCKMSKFVSLSLKIPFIQIGIFYQKVAELLHILIKPFMGSYFIF